MLASWRWSRGHLLSLSLSPSLSYMHVYNLTCLFGCLADFLTHVCILCARRAEWQQWEARGPSVPVHGMARSRCARAPHAVPGLPAASQSLQPSRRRANRSALQVLTLVPVLHKLPGSTKLQLTAIFKTKPSPCLGYIANDASYSNSSLRTCVCICVWI